MDYDHFLIESMCHRFLHCMYILHILHPAAFANVTLSHNMPCISYQFSYGKILFIEVTKVISRTTTQQSDCLYFDAFQTGSNGHMERNNLFLL